MATIKKGITVRAREMWKHLKPFNKRQFWKRQRNADKDFVRIESGQKAEGNAEVYRRRFEVGDEP